MIFRVDFYVNYDSGPHCIQRFPLDLHIEHESYGRPSNAWRDIEKFIIQLCERRDFFATQDTLTFFRMDRDPLLWYHVNNAIIDVIAQNAKHLVAAVIECLNLYVPEKYLRSFAHFLFKTFPCCQESYRAMTNEAARIKKRFTQEGRKAEYKPPQLIMRKSYYIPMRHHRDDIILPHRSLDSDDLRLIHDQLDEAVAAHLWNEDNPYTTCSSEPFISMAPHIGKPNCILDLYGVSPYLIETFRVAAGHRANYVIADMEGTFNKTHSWQEWHVLNLNTFAAYIMTTAIYHQYEYDENMRDCMYMQNIWETIAQLACLNTDREGSNILWKRSNTMFDTGIVSIIKSW